MKLLFATHNKHKAKEIALQCGGEFSIVTLDDLDINDDIPETADTLLGNARIKAQFLYGRYNRACFADDTGLEVEALGGAPGIYSARYAGPDCIAENNMNKLLAELDGKENRKAHFKTIIVFIDEKNEEYVFEGKVEGKIGYEKKGEKGFGYDPIFIPDEADGRTFAQMTTEEKNIISHRARAVAQFVKYLKEQYRK